MNTQDLKLENEDSTLPFIMNYLPDFVLKKAEEELNESSENKTSCLLELKEMIKGNETTCDIEFLDDYLIQFLRHSKYRVSKAFSQLQKYVSVRKKNPKLFEYVPDEEFLKISSRRIMTFLPKRSPDGCVIGLIKVGNFNPDEMIIDDIWRLTTVSLSQTLRDPMTQVCGYKGIFDYGNVSKGALWFCTPQNAWFYYSLVMKSFPGRYKEIHVVNESAVLKTIWTLIKTFLSEKMKKRFYFHSSPEKLLDFFPRSVLPVEYGGELKDYFISEWLQNANKQLGESSLEGQHNYF